MPRRQTWEIPPSGFMGNLGERGHGGIVIPPRSRKDERGSPLLKANASQFYPNHRWSMHYERAPPLQKASKLDGSAASDGRALCKSGERRADLDRQGVEMRNPRLNSAQGILSGTCSWRAGRARSAYPIARSSYRETILGSVAISVARTSLLFGFLDV
jgi:hypothetical protein